MVFCLVWFLQIILTSRSENSTVLEAPRPWSGVDPGLGSVVWRVSVPEEHRLCLPCGLPQERNWIWTHGNHKVALLHQDQDQDRDHDQEQDRNNDQDLRRFDVKPNGTLCLLKLEPFDSGDFFCNGRLRLDLQVLTGRFFLVPAGRTLLLPCRDLSKPKQRWSWKGTGAKMQVVLTRFSEGTVKVAREDGRLGYEHDALRILDLQPGDAGEYKCNREMLGTVAVETDFVDQKTEEKRPENVLLIVIVAGLGFMVVMMTAVCVLLTSIKCRRKRRRRRAATQRAEATELQPRTTAREREGPSCVTPEEEEGQEEEIHYASLGRPTWKHRPMRTTAEPEPHSVIYSSICTNK